MHHGPDRLIALVASAGAAPLLPKSSFLGGRQKVHRNEPVLKWELARLHHRTGAQRGPEAALFALIAPFVALPVVFGAAAFFAGDALFVAHGLELEPTALLIRILLVKI